jgi:hypothetical protein
MTLAFFRVIGEFEVYIQKKPAISERMTNLALYFLMASLS